MKGTVFDLLKLAAHRPDVAKDLAELAARHGIELTDEVSDDELEAVSGGAESIEDQLVSQGEITDSMQFDLQSRQQELAQTTQTFANILKQWHDTSKSIINNLKA
jgi:hypothetical protein